MIEKLEKKSKAKREVLRIWTQIIESPDIVIGPILRSRYNKRHSQDVQVTNGSTAAGNKIAILLLYQPNGLVPSVLETCEFLRKNGYSVLAVANGGLSNTARAALSNEVWRVVERPNFGYDFGGFQEGVFLLNEWGIAPDHLVFLNDSIWLPIQPNSTLIDRIESTNAPVTGLLKNVQAKLDRQNYTGPDGFIESYFFHVRGSTITSQVFQKYWRNLAITNVKRKTIDRGEKGFSGILSKHNIIPYALSSRRMFLSEIVKQSNSFLFKTLDYAAYTDHNLEEMRGDLMATYNDGSKWRTAALEHIAECAFRHRFNAGFIFATEKVFELNFLKKHRAPLFQIMRKQYLRAVINGDLLAPSDKILYEIRNIDAPSAAKKGI